MNIEQMLDRIRINRLENIDPFIFEIDLNDKRIKKAAPLISTNKDFEKLKDKLPTSYVKFIQTVANGLYIGIGNALSIYPVGEKVPELWTDVWRLTDDVVDDPLFPSQDFIFFAMTGGDSEMYAFYTAHRFKNGEYPIVWYTPGSIDAKPFVLVNTSFDKFLTMQYYLLKSTDYGERRSRWDEYALEKVKKESERFHEGLYDIFDPTIEKPNYNFYASAKSLAELIDQLNHLEQ